MRGYLKRTIGRQSLAALLIVFLSVIACSKPPRLAPLSPDAVVVAFGDSLTRGTGAPDNSSYPVTLSTLISRIVINAGVPGEVTAEGLERLPEVLNEHAPALLILCHGGNDMMRKLGDEQAAGNIRKMIALARERGVEVVLVGVPRPGISLKPPGFYRAIAEEFQIPYDDRTLKNILSDRSLKSDYIHPNARGYNLLADSIAELLKKSGAL